MIRKAMGILVVMVGIGASAAVIAGPLFAPQNGVYTHISHYYVTAPHTCKFDYDPATTMFPDDLITNTGPGTYNQTFLCPPNTAFCPEGDPIPPYVDIPTTLRGRIATYGTHDAQTIDFSFAGLDAVVSTIDTTANVDDVWLTPTHFVSLGSTRYTCVGADCAVAATFFGASATFPCIELGAFNYGIK